ncbi:MAG: hypothetical protein AAB965_00585 [Patescibacteria group bacterium]
MAVFDAKKALSALNGKSFDSVKLRIAFEDILFNNIKDIPAEFRARDLFELALNNGWLQEVGGTYSICIKDNLADFVEKASKRVNSWPNWKKGGIYTRYQEENQVVEEWAKLDVLEDRDVVEDKERKRAEMLVDSWLGKKS